MKKIFLFSIVTALATSCATPQESKVLSDPIAKVSSVSLNKVHVNQLGYHPDHAKLAILVEKSTSPVSWSLIDGSGSKVATGESQVIGLHGGSAQHVHHIDFSNFTTLGEGYVLSVGREKSFPFNIQKNLYTDVKKSALNYFYQSRAAIDILEKYVERPDLARPAGDVSEIVTCYKGEDQNGVSWPGCDHELNTTGGWYDAGDHGKYITNAGISTWTLLNYYEVASADPSIGDGKMALPEAGNGVNDLLDEARWNVEFMLSMQIPDGNSMSIFRGTPPEDLKDLKLRQTDVSGMVHHKITDVKWTGLPLAPHENTSERALFPPSTTATLNLAAVAAQCARVYKDVDPAFSTKCETAAKRAYAAAKRVPDAHSFNNFDGGGPYDSTDPRQAFYWAAAELYATTTDEVFRKEMLVARAALDVWPTPASASPGWNRNQPLGTISLTVALAEDNPEAKAAADAIVTLADGYMTQIDQEAYAIPFAREKWTWGSLGEVANVSMVLGTAHHLSDDPQYLAGMRANMDYIFGRNPMDQSYVTGYGDRPMRNPHHRFWAYQVDPTYPLAPSGILSGGPNNSLMIGPVSSKMVGQCEAQTCWADDINAWALNELTINWNAPFFWSAAYIDYTE